MGSAKSKRVAAKGSKAKVRSKADSGLDGFVRLGDLSAQTGIDTYILRSIAVENEDKPGWSCRMVGNSFVMSAGTARKVMARYRARHARFEKLTARRRDAAGADPDGAGASNGSAKPRTRRKPAPTSDPSPVG